MVVLKNDYVSCFLKRLAETFYLLGHLLRSQNRSDWLNCAMRGCRVVEWLLEEEVLAEFHLLLRVIRRAAAFNHRFVHLIFGSGRAGEERLNSLSVGLASLPTPLLPCQGIVRIAVAASWLLSLCVRVLIDAVEATHG